LPNRRTYERILNYSSFCVSASIAGLFVSRPDVIIATSPQLLVGLAGWWLARWKHVPFVFEVRDLWPESLVAVGVSEHGSFFHRSVARIADFLYRGADRVVVVTPAFEDYLVKSGKVSPEKIAVVQNGVETDIFTPAAASDDVRRELGAAGRFIVCYVGTMGMAHGLETLINAAIDLQAASPNVLFLLVGEGADRERITSLARSKGLTNIRFLGQQPRGKIPAIINASDACLVLLKKTDVFKTVIPTKMLEFMSCARPVILGVDGQARSILERADAGILVEPENAIELVGAIRRLETDPKLRDLLGCNGRRHILQHFSRHQTATSYISILEDMLKIAPPRRSAAA